MCVLVMHHYCLKCCKVTMLLAAFDMYIVLLPSIKNLWHERTTRAIRDLAIGVLNHDDVQRHV